MSAESARLEDCRKGVPWKKWGPYLSERQWGTVREDYSRDGDAWNHFSHDQARSRAYQWGEDGIAGISDDHQHLCFALALWNGQDPILKERMFGLTNQQSNHGEDVKEYYFYLDSTPTHSYMKHLYKYPQAAYPYDELVSAGASRGPTEPEYELLDTGIFAGDRYFDVITEYAKEAPEDLVIRVTVANRSPEPAALHVLPTLWFRNTWSGRTGVQKPEIRAGEPHREYLTAIARHLLLGTRYLHCQPSATLLFTENETNAHRLYGTPADGSCSKDGINDYVVEGKQSAVNAAWVGTKVAVHHRLEVAAGATATLYLKLCASDGALPDDWIEQAERTFAQRQAEANEFYADLISECTTDEMVVFRQALAGMLWTKQFYYYDVQRWLDDHGQDARKTLRNRQWQHMCNEHVISMPDKWEYPWYAAWDLAFHAVALSIVDQQFAEEQLELMLRSMYLHPNGQIPAYEWNFSDVNPPVHAWAVLFMHMLGKSHGQPLSFDYLRNVFHRLALNFNWWVNRKDASGHNVFQGGFLGLDNIGVFDRSRPLPGGGTLEQADGTAWMAFYSQSMMALALELAAHDPLYEEMANKYLEHFLWIGSAMDQEGEIEAELWDEQDGFFYDVLLLPDGRAMRLKIRSMVGLLPLFATMSVEADTLQRFPAFMQRARDFAVRHPQVMSKLAPIDRKGVHGRRLLSVVNEVKLRRLLARMLDTKQFLSPYGIRSLSREHLEQPYTLDLDAQRYTVKYLPAESDSRMFGGNSNWRGPVWFPVNALIIRALLEFYRFYGDELRVECPTGSGKMMTLFEVAQDLCRRQTSIFLRDRDGRRPVYGGTEVFQSDPHWRDHLLFFEYFHGDDGAGIGASHQTGWTGLVARALQISKLLPDSFTAPRF
jgi:hypothetical protein